RVCRRCWVRRSCSSWCCRLSWCSNSRPHRRPTSAWPAPDGLQAPRQWAGKKNADSFGQLGGRNDDGKASERTWVGLLEQSCQRARPPSSLRAEGSLWDSFQAFLRESERLSHLKDKQNNRNQIMETSPYSRRAIILLRQCS